MDAHTEFNLYGDILKREWQNEFQTELRRKETIDWDLFMHDTTLIHDYEDFKTVVWNQYYQHKAVPKFDGVLSGPDLVCRDLHHYHIFIYDIRILDILRKDSSNIISSSTCLCKLNEESKTHLHIIVSSSKKHGAFRKALYRAKLKAKITSKNDRKLTFYCKEIVNDTHLVNTIIYLMTTENKYRRNPQNIHEHEFNTWQIRRDNLLRNDASKGHVGWRSRVLNSCSCMLCGGR